MNNAIEHNFFDKLDGPAHFVSKLIIEELYRNDVVTFAVSPGARLIPLLEAVKEHPKTNLNLFNDERQAAFWAQGYAKASRRPVVLIVTSGTAVANLLPGIMEAYYSRVPLIVMTCDRPWELQKSGANQTVEQNGIFAKYVLTERSLPAIENSFSVGSLLSSVDDLVSKASSTIAGPVHLNIAFRKPYDFSDFDLKHFLEEREADIFELWNKSKQRFRFFTKSITGTNLADLDFLVKAIDAARNPLIVVGPLSDSHERVAVSNLLKHLNLKAFADINSGLRGDPNILSLYNLYLDQLTPANYDLLIYLGDRIVSEKLRSFVEKVPAIKILINNSDRKQDAVENEFINFNYHYFVDLAKYLASLSYKTLGREVAESTKELIQLEDKAAESLAKVIESYEGNYLAKLAKLMPVDSQLYHSSSLILRELEYFAKPEARIDIIANRGCVGIDGVLASAVGYASGKDRKTFLAIGDQALIYDLTSLTLIPEKNFAVVLINNQGGAVFKILNTQAEAELINPQNVDFKLQATSFGLNYTKLTQISELEDYKAKWQGDFDSEIIEIVCDQENTIDFFNNAGLF